MLAMHVNGIMAPVVQREPDLVDEQFPPTEGNEEMLPVASPVDNDATPTQSFSHNGFPTAWGVGSNSGGDGSGGRGIIEEASDVLSSRAKRRRRPSAKARESSVYNAETSVRRRSRGSGDRVVGSKARSPKTGPKRARRTESSPTMFSAEKERIQRKLDRAPWRDEHMPKKKLRAYRDPNGRFRVMDFNSNLLKSLWLNRAVKEAEGGGSGAQNMPPREGANVQDVVEVAGSSTPEASPSRKKRKKADPKKVLELHHKNDDTNDDTNNDANSNTVNDDPNEAHEVEEKVGGDKLFEAMFNRPRAPGKRAPKVEKARAIALFNTIGEASSDSDFQAEENEDGGDGDETSEDPSVDDEEDRT
mmetsp:Transcript_455/g.1579  ORF Transcript_455/g.1579 Transcript_455/m.1579 type:complete len:360 (+) Transcript_455:278-1357(+)